MRFSRVGGAPGEGIGELGRFPERQEGPRQVEVRDRSAHPDSHPALVGTGLNPEPQVARPGQNLLSLSFGDTARGGWMRRVLPQRCCLEKGQDAPWALSQLKARTPALTKGWESREVGWLGGAGGRTPTPCFRPCGSPEICRSGGDKGCMGVGRQCSGTLEGLLPNVFLKT